jgi:phosphoenolpyruvate-protein kinase (PTS system EI component)
VARQLNILAAGRGSQPAIEQDDWVIIDGDAGTLIVDRRPSSWPIVKQRQGELEKAGSTAHPHASADD